MKKFSRKTLSAQFLAQVRLLKTRGLPEIILGNHLSPSGVQRDEVLEKASDLEFGNGSTPFLPVIPFTYRSFHDQMPMIEIDGKKGQIDTCMDAGIWRDTNYFHRAPWHIFDVSIGEPLDGQSIIQRLHELHIQGRRALLTEEVISLCLHVQPKTISLFCYTPHSVPWSQSHLVTGGSGGFHAEKGPTVYGLGGNLSSVWEKDYWFYIPSCLK